LIVEEGTEPLVDAILVGNEIVCHYLKDCASYIRVFGLDGDLLREFQPSFRSSFDVMSSNDEKVILVGTSFGTPCALYEYSNGRFKELERRTTIDIRVSEDFAKSKDGLEYIIFSSENESQRRS
jgi:prolyl oligopeptidase PreP (S9A serine peptidase family)